MHGPPAGRSADVNDPRLSEKQRSTNKSVIFRVGANPEPDETVVVFDGNRSVAQTYPR